MKKVLSMIMAFTLIMVLAVPASASNLGNAEGFKPYFFEELKISMALPEEYYVLYEGMEEDDPALEELEIGYEQAMDLMEENGLSVFAMELENENTISLSISEYEGENYDDMELEDLDVLLEQIAEQMAVGDYEIYDYDSFLSNQVYFGYFNYLNKQTKCNVMEYISGRDELMYSLSFSQEGKDYDEDQILASQVIAYSFCLTESPLYMTDEEVTTVYVAPAGCTLDPAAADANGFEDAIRLPYSEDSYLMFYAAPNENFTGDPSKYSVKEVARIFEMNPREIKDCTAGDIPFFMTANEKAELNGFEDKYSKYEFFTFKDGYVYLFTYYEPAEERCIENEELVEEILASMIFDF